MSIGGMEDPTCMKVVVCDRPVSPAPVVPSRHDDSIRLAEVQDQNPETSRDSPISSVPSPSPTTG